MRIVKKHITDPSKDYYVQDLVVTSVEQGHRIVNDLNAENLNSEYYYEMEV